MPSIARLVALLLLVLTLGAAVAGYSDDGSAATGGSSADADAASASSDELAGIAVPDLSGEDGAEAVSTLESEGLAGTTDDATQDGTGCTVQDQDPAAGDDVEEGTEVSLTVDCTQRDWDDQDGEVWDSFSSGFTSGFSDGCDALFSDTPNGNLYNDDTEYWVTDCTNLESEPSDADVPADVPDDPESEGEAIGFDAGCQALFDDAGTDELYWGETSVDATACQAQVPAVASAGSSSGGNAQKSSAPKTSGDTCAVAAASDGTQVRISVDKGEINCSGALALWNAYLAAAPTQAQGSAGLIELDGWACLTAKTARAKDLGGCSSDDESAFSVTRA